jgi:hypothetical protein
MILFIFIVYDLIFLFVWKSDYFGGNWKKGWKRGDFDMVLEEDLDMDLEENGPVLIGGFWYG